MNKVHLISKLNFTLQVLEITSIRNQPYLAINEVKLFPQGYIDKMVNLQGLHLNSTTSDWWPYIFKDAENLKLDGFLVDLVKEAAALMNFTWSSDFTKDWGYVSSESNQTLKGVQGLVVAKKYDFSISTWVLLPHRLPINDIATMISTKTNLFLLPSPPTWDWKFFARPFELKVWIALLLIFGGTGVFIIFAAKCPFSRESVKCASFSVWFLFSFINAYYGGTITMFMLTEPELPFSSLLEAHRFSEWKVICQTTSGAKARAKTVRIEYYFANHYENTFNSFIQRVYQNMLNTGMWFNLINQGLFSHQ